jgi:hypothetical protein
MIFIPFLIITCLGLWFESLAPDPTPLTGSELKPNPYTWEEYGLKFSYQEGWNLFDDKTFGIEEMVALDGIIVTKEDVIGHRKNELEIEMIAIPETTMDERIEEIKVFNNFEDKGSVAYGDREFRLFYYEAYDLTRPHYLFTKDDTLFQVNTNEEEMIETVFNSLEFLEVMMEK